MRRKQEKSKSTIPTLPRLVAKQPSHRENPAPKVVAPSKDALPSIYPQTARKFSMESAVSESLSLQSTPRADQSKRLSHEFSSGTFEPAKEPVKKTRYRMLGTKWHSKEKIEAILRKQIEATRADAYVITQYPEQNRQKGYTVSLSAEKELLWNEDPSFILLLKKSKYSNEQIDAAEDFIRTHSWCRQSKSHSNLHLVARYLNPAEITLEENDLFFFMDATYGERNTVFLRKILELIEALPIVQISKNEMYKLVCTPLIRLTQAFSKQLCSAAQADMLQQCASLTTTLQNSECSIDEFRTILPQVIAQFGSFTINQKSTQKYSKTGLFIPQSPHTPNQIPRTSEPNAETTTRPLSVTK